MYKGDEHQHSLGRAKHQAELSIAQAKPKFRFGLGTLLSPTQHTQKMRLNLKTYQPKQPAQPNLQPS